MEQQALLSLVSQDHTMHFHSILVMMTSVLALISLGVFQFIHQCCLLHKMQDVLQISHKQ